MRIEKLLDNFLILEQTKKISYPWLTEEFNKYYSKYYIRYYSKVLIDFKRVLFWSLLLKADAGKSDVRGFL
ncbi:hypothetical protein SAMN02910340_01715 [Methanosarcina thermophila]|jgi:hypothetical protein|uniref:Uncharacterized protein n=1 Tax=Methanosarcina thermophila TaxID=2210 RepID=A0A1I6ZW98_METTE|nr:MAG: hypothetical protein AAY43_10770 [Methanosarcina sp. 795]SFT66951.1 hypothetical protein SAMN02910340_01715 [Methanosarcina thermophila]